MTTIRALRPPRPGAASTPNRLRTFNPVRIGHLEYQAWVGYYQRRWLLVLAASVGLVRQGFGMSWSRTLHGDRKSVV